ncbi:MAG: hypothetical protein EXR72_05525 [Myxococcales bacterium]|nr:hypothetical protein [Myxococcales bacterium]
MRPRSLYALGFLALATAPLLSCESLDNGKLPEDPSAPVLMKILIQDELPRGGRNVATDLLDKSPKVSCSEQKPCTTGDHFSHPPCNLDTKICPDPLKPEETPPALGAIFSGTTGGNQIRIIFSKILAPEIATATINMMTGRVDKWELKDPSIIGFYDAHGNELAAEKSWDPTGSPTLTSDLFLNPLGPALVLKPKNPMNLFTTYSIRLKPELIKDAKGQAVTKDINKAAVATSYEFKTEGLHAAGGALADLNGVLDVKDVLVIKTSALFVPRSLKAVVRRDGEIVETAASPGYLYVNGVMDPNQCTPAPQINIFRVSGRDRAEWEEGDYTVSIEAISIESCGARFSMDPFGLTPFEEVAFKVKRKPEGVDDDKHEPFLAKELLLEWECALLNPADMITGCAADGGVGGQ